MSAAATPTEGDWSESARERSPHGRRWLLAGCVLALIAAGLAASQLLHAKHPQIVSQVRVSGPHGSEAREITAALTSAALGQSLATVAPPTLQSAVSPFQMVGGLTVTPRPPDGVDIRVIERFPVAVIVTANATSAVDAGGAVLGSSLISAHLPEIVASSLPAHQIGAAATLRELAVLGSAPLVMLHRAARIYSGAEGITVSMRNGLEIVFGDDLRPAAKWRAAEAVVADSHAAGASYIDVRDPDRPAAGGLSSSDAAPTGVDPTEAELADQLEQAVAQTTSGSTTDATSDTVDQSQVAVPGADGPGGTVGASSTSSGG